MRAAALGCLVLATIAACGSPAPPASPTAPSHTYEAQEQSAPADAAVTESSNIDIDSKDILARQAEATEVQVKHVLIAWKELAREYHGRLDPRAAQRAQRDAARLAIGVAETLRRSPADIDVLIDKHGEDPGALNHEPYTVKPAEPFVPEFKNLSLRLAINEVGIVQTKFGYHVIVRVAPPPPDPLQSNDILARPVASASVEVLYVMIGWTGVSTQGATRSKAEADALATQVLDQARAGADMAKLAKQQSDDRSTNDGKRLEISATTSMPDPIRDLALRLQTGESGMVKSKVGWIVMKRVPPPPPDPLESAAIMKRPEVAERVKVKHILLGWKDNNGGGDERGAKRTRKDLEKLVKATVAKLKKKGAKIEPLMADLSEDPGSAQSGESYEATPDSPLVAPFKQLSLRLKVGEVGVVKTTFGIHIIQRVE
jgi:parvulin-like peptidyl-prolyl isomerase